MLFEKRKRYPFLQYYLRYGAKQRRLLRLSETTDTPQGAERTRRIGREPAGKRSCFAEYRLLQIISLTYIVILNSHFLNFTNKKRRCTCQKASTPSSLFGSYLTSTQPFLIAVTTACVRSLTCIFCKMLDTWFLTVFSEINKVSPMTRLLWPSVNN